MNRTATPQSGITGPATVPEGGDVRIDVHNGAKKVNVYIAGHGRRVLLVQDGIAEFRLPPGVAGGTRILVSDHRVPNPSTIEIVVTGGH
ncbi:MAG: hypothetical protein AB7I09_20210 [Planctomycetota bacterium]